jgi:tetratricopeptide (TPR) repeat protein
MTIHMDMGHYDQAVADFTRAVGAKEAYIWSTWDRGRAYSKLGRLDLAVKDFTAVLEQEPKHVWAHRERGLAYLGLGQLDSAPSRPSDVPSGGFH